MQPSPEQNYLVLIALSILLVSERAWSLTAKIITFFDKRAARKKRAKSL